MVFCLSFPNSMMCIENTPFLCRQQGPSREVPRMVPPGAAFIHTGNFFVRFLIRSSVIVPFPQGNVNRKSVGSAFAGEKGGFPGEAAQHNQYSTKATEMSILILPEICFLFLWNIPS